MAAFRGTFTHELRGTVELEARQEADGHWLCVARIGSKRFELSTFGDLWGMTLQQVTQSALDSPPFETSPRSKLEKRTHPPVTPPRRRAIRSIVSNPPPTD